MTTHSTDASSSGPGPPRTVSAVLCREVGAQHPDGALKQIRTMKRLLRSHYRVKQRLEDYGVESLEDAVSHIATLTQRLERIRRRQRERAQRRLTVIEALLDKMDLLRSGTAGADEAPTPPNEESPLPLQKALDLVDALSTELNELRLELWLQQTDDAETDESSADALLDQLGSLLTETSEMVNRLRREQRALRRENDQLQQEVTRLQETVDQQQAHIDALEQSPRTPTPASTDV